MPKRGWLAKPIEKEVYRRISAAIGKGTILVPHWYIVDQQIYTKLAGALFDLEDSIENVQAPTADVSGERSEEK